MSNNPEQTRAMWANVVDQQVAEATADLDRKVYDYLARILKDAGVNVDD
jgi:hypothetical protein